MCTLTLTPIFTIYSSGPAELPRIERQFSVNELDSLLDTLAPSDSAELPPTQSADSFDSISYLPSLQDLTNREFQQFLKENPTFNDMLGELIAENQFHGSTFTSSVPEQQYPQPGPLPDFQAPNHDLGLDLGSSGTADYPQLPAQDVSDQTSRAIIDPEVSGHDISVRVSNHLALHHIFGFGSIGLAPVPNELLSHTKNASGTLTPGNDVHESDQSLSIQFSRPGKVKLWRPTDRQTPRKNIKTMGLNQRHANIESLDPNKYYEPVSEIPGSWGGLDDEGVQIFQYNLHGELAPKLKFRPDQIADYLYNHPLNFPNGVYNPRNSGLTLWIQTVPADSGRRYPSQDSDKCRFMNCPVNNHTIHKGSFRVAFDEHSSSGLNVDPFYCAGYVHLYCLERFCDFPTICQNLKVRPDTRVLPEGKNKMAVTRDHDEMLDVVKIFMLTSQTMANYDYDQTLCCQLTVKHLELEPKGRQVKRRERGGNHIGLHKGDLEKYVEGRKKNRGPVLPGPQKKRKRKRDKSDEESELELCFDDDDDNGSSGNYLPRQTKRHKGRR